MEIKSECHTGSQTIVPVHCSQALLNFILYHPSDMSNSIMHESCAFFHQRKWKLVSIWICEWVNSGQILTSHLMTLSHFASSQNWCFVKFDLRHWGGLNNRGPLPEKGPPSFFTCFSITSSANNLHNSMVTEPSNHPYCRPSLHIANMEIFQCV